jgi:hypothetical protein
VQLRGLTSGRDTPSAQVGQTGGEVQGPRQMVESARSALDTAMIEVGSRETELQFLETGL